MRRLLRSTSILLLLYAALFADATLGQSLSIIRKGEKELWVEATAPADIRHVLQGSADLHFWVDIHDDVQGRFSYRLDNAAVTRRFFRLTPWEPPAPPVRVVVVGDSTASDVNGWGLGMYDYFKPNAQFVNYAIPGTSTKLFLRSDEMAKMVALRPDYVLVQLGMMDTASDPGIGTTPEEYAGNLRTIVQTVRGFDGVPILITVHAARLWDGYGKLLPTWQDRNAVVRAVAAELQVHLIDLYQLTKDLYTKLGQSGSSQMESVFFPGESMHFSPEGGQVIAGLVVRALPASLAPYVLENPIQPPGP